MNRYRFVIPGVLPDFNAAITKAKSGNVRKGGKFANPYQDWKKVIDESIAWQAKDQLRGVKITGNCAFVLFWYAPDRMKDPDNIGHAIKYILDGLQKAGVLPGDGWKNASGGTLHLFGIDAAKPRVEVLILEGETLFYD